ncbi:MAG: CoA transferase [Burkholderiales bacterium]|nr:CoA transferase [Burkholderiales bacterium]
MVDGERPPLRLPEGEWAGRARAREEPAQRAPRVQALEGLRILEFGGYAAGPHIGKMLANFGALVVHVESRTRPDGFRLQYPPYRGGRPGVDNGACFAYFNDSKLGLTLELKNAAGRELARRLAGWADVIIENMRPGVIGRLDLGYESLAAINPALVMLSTCNLGQTGPRADTPGFGSQLTALVGLCGLTGYRGGSPMLLYGPYVDFIASSLGAVAVLAALERRRITGRGARLDLSQYESGLMFLAGALLDFHRRGAVAERAGNEDPHASPHGVYRCGDGEWLALSCWSDAAFGRLARAIGRPELAADPRMAGVAARKEGRESVDRALAAWLGARGAREAADLLQRARVPSHPVNSVADLFCDAQLAARRQWRRLAHPVIGEHAYCMPAFELAETPGEVHSAAPLLGADNERVLRDLLGLSPEEIGRYRAAGALG